MILEKLQKEMIKAMKEKETLRLSVIRMLITEIKNEDKVKGNKRPEDEVCMAYHKKLVKAIEMFPEDKREELRKEIKIVEEFLPKMMTKEEIISFIKNGNFEKIDMKSIMPLLKGKAEGKLVQEIISSWEK